MVAVSYIIKDFRSSQFVSERFTGYSKAPISNDVINLVIGTFTDKF